MKIEPLKNKITCLGTSPKGNDVDICYKEDIKSAVEWLKKELMSDDMMLISCARVSVKNKIDEAFEDVTK